MTFVRLPSPPPPSFMAAMKTVPSGPVVSCTLRMKPALTVTGEVQVVPPSEEEMTCSAPPPTLKLFQERYMRP